MERIVRIYGGVGSKNMFHVLIGLHGKRRNEKVVGGGAHVIEHEAREKITKHHLPLQWALLFTPKRMLSVLVALPMRPRQAFK